MTGTMSIRIRRPTKTRKKRVWRLWADLYFDSQTWSQKVSVSSTVLPQTMQCLWDATFVNPITNADPMIWTVDKIFGRRSLTTLMERRITYWRDQGSGGRMVRLTFAILIALSSGLFLGADAKMYIVDDDGFAQYHTIGEAVDVAKDGDTIYVKPGIYREHIVMNKSIVLMPPRGEEGVVGLVGDGNDIGIEVLADGCKIEGLTISDFAGPGIYVESRGNEIKNNVLVGNVHGIFLNGTSGNVIQNNREEGGYCGIVLLSSSENTVTGNVAKDCRGSKEVPGAGILLNSAARNSISGCEAEGSSRGVYLVSESTDNGISGSRITSCTYGILVEAASNSIRESTFENATTAIALNSAAKNLIEKNAISNSTNGIVLFTSMENVVAENRLSGLDVVMMISAGSEANVLKNNHIENANSGIVISESPENIFDGNHLAGVQLGLTVDGSAAESFNNSIPESNTIDGVPILYLYGRSGEVVTGREFSHITLASCENCTVEGCTVTNDALFTYASRGCRILENVVSKAYGMLIRSSDGNEFRGNEASENRYGGMMLVDSGGNAIVENNLSRNGREGLLLRKSDNNRVLSNAAEANRDAGIRLLISNETEIAENSVIGNGVGISINGSSGCIVYRNNLIENVVQAEDDGNNLWDWGALKGGNHWSDHPCGGSPCLDKPRAVGVNTTDFYPYGERDGWAR